MRKELFNSSRHSPYDVSSRVSFLSYAHAFHVSSHDASRVCHVSLRDALHAYDGLIMK